MSIAGLRPALALAAVTMLFFPLASVASETRPNIVVIFVDDLGYGDLGSFGSETIATPRLDRMAAEGTKFTSFYAQSTCGASRSALLTGRYPIRSKGWGMPGSEITFAELLKTVGYSTAIVGKWDVSNRQYIPARMPNAQGFDYFWGTLGASDKRRTALHHNTKGIGFERDRAALTRRYTNQAIEFIQKNRARPFLLYLAHSMVHVEVDASPAFKGKSKNGIYGDAVQELDFHTGRLLDAIDALGLADRTLVIFSSDNGPWSNDRERLREQSGGEIVWGSAGPLRGAKGSTYEGGVRVPTIVRWPATVPAGRESAALFSTLDLLPTFAALSGSDVPTDRPIDGLDQTKLLAGRDPDGARRDFWYFHRDRLNAVRKGKWKLVLPDQRHFDYVDDTGSGQIELYDLESDASEKTNVAAAHPEVVRELQEYIESNRERYAEKKDPYLNMAEFETSELVKHFQNQFDYDNAPPVGNLRFDFENGELQGWNVVDGAVLAPVTDETGLIQRDRKRANHQGRYFLSTKDRSKRSNNSKQIAVLESPRFKNSGDEMSFLVGGGGNTEVALYAADSGEKLRETNGRNAGLMRRVNWDVSAHKNTVVFLRISDRGTKNAEFVDFDDFSCDGKLVPDR